MIKICYKDSGLSAEFRAQMAKIHMQHFGVDQTPKREQICIKQVGNNRRDIIVTPLLF
ncbi:MAG: hypothetical protein CM15mP21_2180 [Hyphomicrobiales bacterium]|nr:MAG: hypothetical protein CM15mP21_2180 [Hyphomicrobiales bacterium]